MRQSKHPLVERDLIGIVDHIVEVTQGDFNAAARRLDEIDDLIRDIAANPMSGMRLTGPLDGWLVRHGGRGHRLTIVFRADVQRDLLQIALVAFGGQDWVSLGAERNGAEF
jgi:plasmid stabilization system protein ParE